MQLTASAYQRALDYITHHARPVDQAWWRCMQGETTADTVLAELAAFQNDDGGFGHGIEPDFRAPDSTATATTVAFQYLAQAKASADDPVVQRGVQYLLDSFDADARAWAPVVPAIADHPRAPWWQPYPTIPFAPEVKGWGNPNAEAIGYLHAYANLVEPGFLAERTADALAWIETVPEMESHEALCVMRLTEVLPEAEAKRVDARLRVLLPGMVETDPSKWASYGAQPIWFATSPSSPWADLFPETLQANLDFIIQEQQDDGSWPTTWSWTEYLDVWTIAQQEWMGYRTTRMLKLLMDFDRIDRD